MTKPGYKTTEFWMTILTMTIGTLLASGVITNSPVLNVLGVGMDVLGVLGYQYTRMMVKQTDSHSAISVLNGAVGKTLIAQKQP